MNRFVLVLALGIAAVGGALTHALLDRPAPAETDSVAVRSIVEEVLKERDALASAEPVAAASIDPAVLNPMIEQFLMSDPKVLQRVSIALDETLKTEEQSKARTALTAMHDAIYNAPGQIVLGNPEGDVTLVEFFDYNCGYCRAALPDMAALLAQDPNLKVILKEFPILSNESIEAARVAVLVNESDADYWSFHQALFSGRGKVDKDTALKAAAELGLSPVNLELQMGEERVGEAIQSSYEIAQELGISGTPTYIIGNEIIPGAIGLDGLKERIANMRACGEASCG